MLSFVQISSFVSIKRKPGLLRIKLFFQMMAIDYIFLIDSESVSILEGQTDGRNRTAYVQVIRKVEFTNYSVFNFPPE